ncbi:hypothetical protein MAF45_09660 [Mesosutterella sp. OilRF-GAM-744-9]|uniref:Helix-turn-helix domain-containing protein n=1 Tax=Mesosutterella porci TaxID=2915351 RepID=A0ABS9MSW4_9BURK|nr:AlpA family phage regulatory protein [Mesosutterella sp. oilRF-744-WT-GAM-9]MCG5031704.1 hypothetical protein [Mesosutterella sp. oilRF-744-WT-GAM-9]
MRKRSETKPELGYLMVDVKQAAAMLSIGVSTVWKKVKNEPSFPQPVYFSKKCARFKVEDIKRWVKEVKAEDKNETASA